MSTEEFQFFSVVAIAVILWILCSDIHRIRTEKEHRIPDVASVALASLAVIGLQIGLFIATYYPEWFE